MTKDIIVYDKNANDKILRDKQVAERERKVAERERLEAIQIRKKMMDLKQKALLEYRHSLANPSTIKNADKKGLLRHVAAIVIQSAWRNYKGYVYKDVSKSPRKSKILKKSMPMTDKNAIVSRYKVNANYAANTNANANANPVKRNRGSEEMDLTLPSSRNFSI